MANIICSPTKRPWAVRYTNDKGEIVEEFHNAYTEAQATELFMDVWAYEIEEEAILEVVERFPSNNPYLWADKIIDQCLNEIEGWITKPEAIDRYYEQTTISMEDGIDREGYGSIYVTMLDSKGYGFEFNCLAPDTSTLEFSGITTNLLCVSPNLMHIGSDIQLWPRDNEEEDYFSSKRAPLKLI